MRTVQIVLFDGFDLLDAIAPYEVFHSAASYAGDALRVEFVTAEGPRLVRSGINGLPIEASGTLHPNLPGVIVVPGAAGELEGDGPHSIPVILGKAASTQLTALMKLALDQKGQAGLISSFRLGAHTNEGAWRSPPCSFTC